MVVVFACFDWFLMLLPSLCCMQGNSKYAINFDSVFTSLKLENTPVDKRILQQNPNAFAGFSYCSSYCLADEQITHL